MRIQHGVCPNGGLGRPERGPGVLKQSEPPCGLMQQDRLAVRVLGGAGPAVFGFR